MTEKKDCILMDVDGVLLDLVPAVAEFVLHKYNLHITPRMITAWDWDYCLGVPLQSIGAPANEFWDFIWNSELKMYPKAMEFIDTLKSLGFRVVAVSQRSSKAAQENAARQFPAFGFDFYLLVNGSMEKVRYSHEINAKWSLEDNPKTAAALGMNKDDLNSYVIDRPWNSQALSITGAYKRLYDYDDFIKILMKHIGWDND